MKLLDRIAMSLGYDIGTTNRFRKLWAHSRSANQAEDQQWGSYDRENAILECMDLWRNDEIAHGICSRFIDHVVGVGGIRPQANTSSKAWNEEAEAYQAQRSKIVDYRQRPGCDMVGVQRMAVLARLLSGDIFFELMDSPWAQLNPVEGLLVRTPPDKQSARVIEGCEVNAGGMITGYYICPRNENGGVDSSKATRRDRRDVFHVSAPAFRPDMLRGIPELAAVGNKLRDYGETDTYIVNTLKNQSLRLYKAKTNGGPANMNKRNMVVRTDSDGQQQLIETNEWGQIVHLKPNEDMTEFTSQTPNPQVVEYLKHELMAIACCLNLPLEFAILLFTSGSYSAQRLSALAAKQTFQRWNEWLVTGFCQRDWNWSIAKAIKGKLLPKAPVDARGVSEWWKVQWSRPYLEMIDPQAETAAHRERYQLGVSNRRSIALEQNIDLDQLNAERETEIAEQCERAAKINAKYPTSGVTWRDFGCATATTVSPAKAAPAAAPAPTGDQK